MTLLPRYDLRVEVADTLVTVTIVDITDMEDPKDVAECVMPRQIWDGFFHMHQMAPPPTQGLIVPQMQRPDLRGV